jgi:hypothetical protein
MAIDSRHAAAHNDKWFSVEARSEDGTVVLAHALREFLDAIDCAMEWIEREDPERTQTLSVGIFAVEDGVAQQVWSYPSQPVKAAEETTKLVNVFGFDPVAWKPQGREFDVRRSRPRYEPSPAPPRQDTPAEAVPEERPLEDPVTVEATAEETAPMQPESVPAMPRGAWFPSPRTLGPALHALWEDRLSRGLVVAGAISLWLAITLVAPVFFAPVLAAATGLWMTRDRRGMTTIDPDLF